MISGYLCVWGGLLTDRLESKHKKLARQIGTILGFTKPQRHTRTNRDRKGLKQKLVVKEDQDRDRPRPSNEIQPRRRGKTRETVLGDGVRRGRKTARCLSCEVRPPERRQGR